MGTAEVLSPSILDFPSLVLGPITPLIPDSFNRSPNDGASNLNMAAKEKAIKEKGFYLHPSPANTLRDTEPRLLPLFPVTSLRVADSSNASKGFIEDLSIIVLYKQLSLRRSSKQPCGGAKGRVDFMRGSRDIMTTLENRVRGLERVVEDMA